MCSCSKIQISSWHDSTLADSLCNVVYKICAKVLATDFNGFLMSSSLRNKVPLYPGGSHGLWVYSLFEANEGEEGILCCKTWHGKAYDHIEWVYLRKKHDSWVELIMKYVITVSLSVKVNGQLSDFFPHRTRGLKQEDPISPSSFSYVLKASVPPKIQWSSIPNKRHLRWRACSRISHLGPSLA